MTRCEKCNPIPISLSILNKGSESELKIEGVSARWLDKAENSKRNSTRFCGLASALSLKRAGAALYRRLKEYLMTEEQLKENGYPMPHPEKPGRAILFTAEEKKTTDCKLCWLFHSAVFARYITGEDACPACKWSFCIKTLLVSTWCSCCDGSPWLRHVQASRLWRRGAWLQEPAAFLKDEFLQLACHENVSFATRFIVSGVWGSVRFLIAAKD